MVYRRRYNHTPHRDHNITIPSTTIRVLVFFYFRRGSKRKISSAKSPLRFPNNITISYIHHLYGTWFYLINILYNIIHYSINDVRRRANGQALIYLWCVSVRVKGCDCGTASAHRHSAEPFRACISNFSRQK